MRVLSSGLVVAWLIPTAALALPQATADEDAVASEEGAPSDPRTDFPRMLSDDAAARIEEVIHRGRRRDLRARAALIKVLEADADAEVRARAAWSLGRIGVPGAIDALDNAAATDASRRVRRAAMLALGQIDDANARQRVLAALQSSDETVAAAAAEGLGYARDPSTRGALLVAAKDPRPLVSLTAKRALAQLPAEKPKSADVVAPVQTSAPVFSLCRDGQRPPDCYYRRDRSDGMTGDAFFVAGAAGAGALAGTFLLDGLRPYRRGVRVTPKRTLEADNTSTPLERAIFAGLGAAAGGATAGTWAFFDDVTLSRAALIGLMTAGGAGVGAAASLAFAMPRHSAVLSVITLGAASGVAATLVTWLPRDFSYGDVGWVATTAALGFGAGALAALVVIPAGTGRARGREGFLVDAADLFGLQRSLWRFPWGEVSRLELSVAGGLVTSGLVSVVTASTIGLYEVGIGRALKTLGAALLAGALLGVPAMLFLPTLPSPFPTPERVGAALALVGGLGGAVAGFTFSSNEEGQGPLIYFESARKKPKREGGIALAPPTVAVLPPLPPSLGRQQPSGPGVYVGLINARY